MEEFIRLLPEGIGVIPLFLDDRKGTEEDSSRSWGPSKRRSPSSSLNLDLIHPEGAPPFMVRGYRGSKRS